MPTPLTGRNYGRQSLSKRNKLERPSNHSSKLSPEEATTAAVRWYSTLATNEHCDPLWPAYKLAIATLAWVECRGIASPQDGDGTPLKTRKTRFEL
uniref:Uncharacterized protein n=1 Tax=Trichuris muris TaxID=70415 RepID=A0A5S6QCR6_TRIMR